MPATTIPDPPTWNPPAGAKVSPSGAKQTTGWLTSEKPPAQNHNWFWAGVYLCLAAIKSQFDEGAWFGDGLQASGDEAVPRVELRRPVNTVADYVLMWQSTVHNLPLAPPATPRIRCYSLSTGSSVQLMEITINASWDGNDWNKDTTGVPAASLQISGAGIIVQTRAAGNDAAWADWDAEPLSTDIRSREVFIGANAYAIDPGTDADWLHQASGTMKQVTTGRDIVIPLDMIPDGATISSVTLYVKAAAGHGALPAAAERIQFRVNDVLLTDGSSNTIAGTYDDPSASVGAYEAYHTISSGGISLTLDRSAKRYNIVVEGESGGNFVTGALVYGARVNYDVTQVT